MSNAADWTSYFGAPVKGAADACRARRDAAAARGERALAAHDSAAARNSAHLWAEVEAADEVEVES